MRNIFLILFLGIVLSNFSKKCESSLDDKLFLVNENNRFGFINIEGKEVIKTIYRSAGEFSEGVANVRIDGTHGYINKDREMVIPPQYDYANPFKWGLAKVYKDGVPFFIDKQGTELLDYKVYKEINPIDEKRAIVETKSKKFGCIDKSGNLIVDTVYSYIAPYIEGLATASKISSSNPDDRVAGVIDTLGKTVIPFGKYHSIKVFENGYFKVSYINDKSKSQIGLTDKTGKMIFEIERKNSCYISDLPHCGLMKLNFYKQWKSDSLGGILTANSYQGFMNLKGELIIHDSTYQRVSNFSFNRAIVQDNSRNQFLIKTNGERIEADSIDKIHSHEFINGFAIASYQKRSGIIDTNGVYIIKPTFKGISGLYDGYFAFFQDGFYGIKDLKGKTILEPIMKSFDRNGFKNGLLKSVIDKRTAYVNMKGEVVWRSSTYAHYKYYQTNIDYQKQAYYNVRKNKNYHQQNGEKFYSKEVGQNSKFPKDSLSVVVEKISLIDRIRNKNYRNARSFFVHVTNRLDKDIKFSGANGSIRMKVQAKDKKGKWRDIEKKLAISCGLSFYRGYLKSNHYWTFLTPKYEGDFKTKLRIALEYLDPAESDNPFRKWNTLTVYSNEYDGSVNPAQFWR